MIITPYNQHVRLLSSEPFGWFAPPKFTRAWEPTLLWNHFTHWLEAMAPQSFCKPQEIAPCKAPRHVQSLRPSLPARREPTASEHLRLEGSQFRFQLR